MAVERSGMKPDWSGWMRDVISAFSLNANTLARIFISVCNNEPIRAQVQGILLWFKQ